jgi:hypothetical protein
MTSLVKGTGNYKFIISNSIIQTGNQNNSSPTGFFVATDISTAAGSPSVQILSTTFSDSIQSPIQRSLNSIIFHTADVDGSLRLTDALYNNVTEVTSNCTLTSKDITVRVAEPGITIVLHAPSTIVSGNVLYGNLKMIKNDSVVQLK